MVLGETDKKAANIQAGLNMARTLGENGKECQAEGEAKMVFISLTLKTRNSKRPSRMLARNWKHQWMPCKMSKNNPNWVTRGKSNEMKSKLACILEASESTRLRMGESLPNHHGDHIAGKGDNSLQHYNLVHKFIPMPQAMKIPAAKATVDKEWEKLEKIPAWNLTKVRSKKEVIRSSCSPR